MGLFSRFFGSGASQSTTGSHPAPPEVAGHPHPSGNHPGGPYFNLLEWVRYYKAQHDYPKMLDCCLKSLPHIPAWVSREKREFGRFGLVDIPAVELGCQYWAVLGDERAVSQVEALVKAVPALRESCGRALEFARRDLVIVPAIRKHLEAAGEVDQRKIGAAVGTQQVYVGLVLKRMQNLGMVRRTKQGKNTMVRLA